MKISNISFKRALTPSEMTEYKDVMRQAREKVSGNGHSILIVHDTCLPQAVSTDTGIGHLTSRTSNDFFEFAKNRLGINTIEVLPQGDMSMKHKNGFYNVYNASALSLGSQEIDLELLTEKRYGSILSKEDFQQVVDTNRSTQKPGLANYENIVGSTSPQEKALQKAYTNFINNEKIDKKAFLKYKSKNHSWLERKAIYSVLREENGDKNWKEWSSELDKNLFETHTIEAKRRIKEIKKTHSDKIDFYKFKQFLAEEHLKEARSKLNSKGMKLFGDCLIGFGDDETWAFKKAFKKGTHIGLSEWGLPALNYDEILDSKSPAQKLLKKKVELFAKRYDGIRFDCSWCYVSPKLSDKSEHKFSDKILNIIEDTVKKVKGKKYNPLDLIHEFEADPSDFTPRKNDGKLKTFLANKTQVINSAFLSNNYGTMDSVIATDTAKDGYVIGVGNHDPQPLRQLANNIADDTGKEIVYRRSKQARTLEKIFGLRQGQLDSPTEFSQVKFAEPLRSKNQMSFYMDVFGRSERFDSQAKNNWKNYRYRLSPDFAKEYEKTVASGFGYNPMDGYARVFKLNNFDKTEPTLFQKIIKFRDILQNKATNIVQKAQESKPKNTNKILNICFAILGIGLIGTVVATTQGKIKDINKK